VVDEDEMDERASLALQLTGEADQALLTRQSTTIEIETNMNVSGR